MAKQPPTKRRKTSTTTDNKGTDKVITSKYFSTPTASKPSSSSSSSSSAYTSSFEPLTWKCFPSLEEVEVHTLILGTHPSITSLKENRYFGHKMNAFWWIAGDCLGFRRADGISPSTQKPYTLAQYLRHGEEKVIPYEEQVKVFAANGFALWDIVQSCQRKGSLDSAIRNETPNDIPGFCQKNPSLKRIVIANGSTGSNFFLKHFKEWCFSGDLKPAENTQSQKVFASIPKEKLENARITFVSCVSVSPAAAGFTYLQKRNFWEEHVYNPGLNEKLKNEKKISQENKPTEQHE